MIKKIKAEKNLKIKIKLKLDSLSFYFPLWALIITNFFWGTTFIFTKVLINSYHPFALLSIRFILTSLILFLIYPRTIIRESRNILVNHYFQVFAVINFLAIAFQTTGLQYTTASKSGVITSLCILIVPLVNQFIFKEIIPKFYYITVLFAFCGIYLISFGLTLPKIINFGDLLTFFSAIFYAFYISILEKIANKFSGATIIFYVFLFTAILSLPFIPLIDKSLPSLETFLDIKVLINLFGLIILGGIIPYLLMVYGQKYVSSALAALIYILEPIFTAILSFIFLQERPSFIQLIGMLIIFISLFVGVSILSQTPKNI
ncbi:MAG: DMT family transporter [Oligoflexia bacterium]|nr:DMT family transporter [Oligoflexia bacterium]